MDGDANRRINLLSTSHTRGRKALIFRNTIFSVSATVVLSLAGSLSADDSLLVTTSALPLSSTANDSNAEALFNDVDSALERRGSVTFRKTSLSEVVFMLSELWKVNIVAGAEITGEISGTFHDAPLREVLAAILTANNYGYRRAGHSLIVLPMDRVGSDDPSFVSQTLNVGTSATEPTLEAARLLLSPGGQMRAVGTDKILVIDHPDRVERVRALFDSISTTATVSMRPQPQSPTTDATLPAPQYASPMQQQVNTEFSTGIAYFTPQYADAEPMATALREALGDSVSVAVFAEENRILILGTAEQLRMATDAVAHLDVPRAQVRIRALIYDVGLKELEAIGVDWSHGLGTSQNTVAGTTGLGFSLAEDALIGGSTLPLAAANEGSNLVLRSLNNSFSVSTFINALDSTAGAKLLADPTITVADRSQAQIKIVQKIPVASTSQLGGTTTAVTSVTFQEAGITLNVTPRISRDSTIQLQVKPEYSVVVGTSAVGGAPIIDSRTAETLVRVADRQMFVLGGLRQSAATETVKGVPFLMDIKYVGKLFRSHRTEIRESELIVFIQPEIIDEFYAGTAREQRAACIANKELDRIPVADDALFIPDCQDCNCPYHHPRMRVNGGSSSLKMIGDVGTTYEVFTETVADTETLPSPLVETTVDDLPQLQMAHPLRP